MGSKRAFVLRLIPSGKDLMKEGLEKDRISVGWPDVTGLLDPHLDFYGFRERVKATYNINDNRSAGAQAGHLWRFLREMKPGDYVVVPYGAGFYVAEVLGEPYFDGSDDYSGYHRPVRWLNEGQAIPRELASARLQARMKIRGTTADASDLVIDIERALEAAQRGEKSNLALDLKKRMLEAVRQELVDGRMNPDRFEELLAQLARAMGALSAEVISRVHDRGADVVARFALMEKIEVTVGIQAKFYRPGHPMGRKAVDQLAQALREGVADMGLVVTTGDVSEEAYEAAEQYKQENLRIAILDGEDLAGLIVDKGLWSDLRL